LAEEMQRVLVMTGVARVRDVTKEILIRDDWRKVR
jgi:isopentenyl diphosphate isomerase/L-lactate dehydrogenase-like FMN-dependent dehydrogenase